MQPAEDDVSRDTVAFARDGLLTRINSDFIMDGKIYYDSLWVAVKLERVLGKYRSEFSIKHSNRQKPGLFKIGYHVRNTG